MKQKESPLSKLTKEELEELYRQTPAGIQQALYDEAQKRPFWKRPKIKSPDAYENFCDHLQWLVWLLYAGCFAVAIPAWMPWIVAIASPVLTKVPVWLWWVIGIIGAIQLIPWILDGIQFILDEILPAVRSKPSKNETPGQNPDSV